MERLLKFKYTKDGMVAMSTDDTQFVLVSEVKLAINDVIHDIESFMAYNSEYISDTAYVKECNAKAEYALEQIEKLKKIILK